MGLIRKNYGEIYKDYREYSLEGEKYPGNYWISYQDIADFTTDTIHFKDVLKTVRESCDLLNPVIWVVRITSKKRLEHITNDWANDQGLRREV